MSVEEIWNGYARENIFFLCTKACIFFYFRHFCLYKQNCMISVSYFRGMMMTLFKRPLLLHRLITFYPFPDQEEVPRVPGDREFWDQTVLIMETSMNIHLLMSLLICKAAHPCEVTEHVDLPIGFVN